MSAKATPKEASGKTVTMTEDQYESIRKYTHSFLELAQVLEQGSAHVKPACPHELVDILANGIADVLEKVDESQREK